MMRSVYLASAMLCVASCSRSPSDGTKSNKDAQPPSRLHPLNDRVSVAIDAIGAGRMFLDPAGRWLLVENTAWRHDMTLAEESEIPPVLRTVDLTGRARDWTGNGWRVAGPRADGSVIYLSEREEEYQYWLTSSAAPQTAKRLESPEGWWIYDGSTSAGGRGVVLLSQRRNGPFVNVHWLAAIDPSTLEVTRSIRRDVEFPRYGSASPVGGLAGAASRPRIVLLHGQGATWTVEAIDVEPMKTVWSIRLPVDEKDVYSLREGIIAVSGDDRLVYVGLGSWERVGLEVSQSFVLDLETGRVQAKHGMLPGTGVVAAVSPIPTQPAVALLRLHSLVDQRESSLAEVAELDLATGASRIRLDVSVSSLPRSQFEQLRSYDPRTLVAGPAGAILAPTSEAGALAFKSAYRPGWLYDGSKSGTDRDSVRGVVDLPPGWHTRSRPRVRAAHGVADPDPR